MISLRFQGKLFNIRVIHVYAPTSNAEEAEVEQFCEDLQDLLELMPKKDVLFTKVRRQCNGLIEGVGVQRLGVTQHSSHSLDTGTTYVVERVLLGE